MTKTLVLKLGGSLITDKSREYCARSGIIRAASAEVRECRDAGLFDRLVIVHGVGSYGHPPVIQHKLHKGFVDKGQLLPISLTQSKVNELRAMVSASLQAEGVPVNYLHASSIAVSAKGRIASMDVKALRGWLDIGMVPVLGGDMIFDEAMGFSVGSGDQLAAILAKEVQATHLVFATDVPGVFDADPKTSAGARQLGELSLAGTSHLDLSGGRPDASGAMGGKIASLATLEPELRRGMDMAIITMMRPGNLHALLEGRRFEGTSIRP
jgi:isopentenyl phosphate kinase